MLVVVFVCACFAYECACVLCVCVDIRARMYVSAAAVCLLACLPLRQERAGVGWQLPDSALRTPEERLPSRAPKTEFGRMIREKKSSLGDRCRRR